MTTHQAPKALGSGATRVSKVRADVRTFTSGLLLGLSSAGLLFAGTLPSPKTSKEGLRSDWKLIGSDIATAIGKYGQ